MMSNMELFRCPRCGFRNMEASEFCVNCGYRLSADLDGFSISVGREGCDIIVNDPEMKVSKHHLDVSYNNLGLNSYYTITNYGGNGTLIGNRQLLLGESIKIPVDKPLPRVYLACDLKYPLNWDEVEFILARNSNRIHQTCRSDEYMVRRQAQSCPCPAPPRQSRTYASRFNPFQSIIGVIASPLILVTTGAISLFDAVKSGISKVRSDKVPHEPITSINNCNTFASIFAPAQVKPKSHMLVQIYLHLFDETENVNLLAHKADMNTERRDHTLLQCNLKNGDVVDVQLSIYSETLLMTDKKQLVWQGKYTKCSFDYIVPKSIDADELCCITILSVNDAIVGEMRFITQIVEQPQNLHPEVFARQYKKIFISYAHQDESKVKYIARAYDAQGVDYFFDRHYLKPGDIFPLKIKEYIDSADLFILCWSANAAQSDYVDLERRQALERAFPKVKPFEEAPLSIYPMSIEPRADLPIDMRDTYNFEVI